MSKFIPDPQIQSLKAMRAGDISFGNGGTLTIGKTSMAARSPEGTKSVNPTTVESIPALSGTPSESPLVGEASSTMLSQNAAILVNSSATETLETLSGTPSESPTVGIGFATSVV